MKLLMYFSFFFAFYHSYLQCTTENLAVVCVPVADLVGSPLDVVHPVFGTTIIDRYNRLPYCGVGAHGGVACPRVHQLLFNEVVTVLSLHEHQACIAIPQVFYITHNNTEPQNIYWTLKSNIMPFSELKQSSASNIIPTPINFAMPTNQIKTKILVLSLPFYDKSLRMTFSAGTRFIINEEKNTADAYAVYIVSPKTRNAQIHFIPTHFGIVQKESSQQEAVNIFLSLVRTWATKGNIPYVWGGCSFCTEIADNAFQEVKAPLSPTVESTYFIRPAEKEKVKTGFDCAGLVARAAQLAGIPYFYKNTLTLSSHLDEMSHNQPLQEGDLIWFSGHVMIVNDLQKNTLIEARSYTSGYGIVHEIPLASVFKGITTYSQLINACEQRKPLVRLNRIGEEVETIKRFKLLKMASAWKKTNLKV